MKKICLSNLQYLLLAMFVMAMIGCGAHNINTGSAPAANSALKATLNYNQGTAKTLALGLPAPTSVQFTVTGTGTAGPLPTVKAIVSGSSATLNGIYPGLVTVAAIGYDGANGTGNVIWEGYALLQPVTAGGTTNVTINMTTPQGKAGDAPCVACHENTLDANGQNLIGEYKQSKHYFSDYSTSATATYAGKIGCAGCHGPSHNDVDPAGNGRCVQCHTAINNNHSVYESSVDTNNPTKTCNACHVTHNIKGGLGCIGCHAIQQKASSDDGKFVNDNNGVRAITGEFTKNAHHVVGKTLTNADCAVCHLEGVAGGAIDPNVHMSDNKIHLRNGNPGLAGNQTAASGNQYVWDPSNPNHTAMDQFCMSCHNSGGAPAAVGIVAGNSASNPFNDGITNEYDQVARPAVVAVFDQFDTTATSHHAVRGKKYSQRSRSAMAATGTNSKAAFVQYSGNPTYPTPSGAVLTNYSTQATGKIAIAAAGIGPKFPGQRQTIYEAGLFVSTYTPLGATVNVGDDSTLHCGDCHSVGQFKPGSTTNAAGVATTAVIGAHGAANEYLLRNALGTDALHHGSSSKGGPNDNSYVCYICHSPTATNGYSTSGGHGGVGSGDCLDTANAESVGKVGFGGSFGTSRAGVQTSGTGGNIFGYTCAHCHNSGQNRTFGGIHGSGPAVGAATFMTYSAVGGLVVTPNTTGRTGNAAFAIVAKKAYRFMGGLSNRYNGGGSVSKWEAATQTKASREGCYNQTTVADSSNTKLWDTGAPVDVNGVQDVGGADASAAGSWGSCGHHIGSTTGGSGTTATRRVQRPLTY